MPVTVVVGGQFGSEGKGKVAHFLARQKRANIVVRVGGSNSGHTVIDDQGNAQVFRQLPTAAVLSEPICVLGPGSYIDPEVLLDEIARIRLPTDRLLIDPNAFVITTEHKRREIQLQLGNRIGSTLSGTGEAVVERIRRGSAKNLACNHPQLQDFTRHGPTRSFLRQRLKLGERVVIEGTQGFGLSNLQSPYYPKATSRDTTASAFVAEAGLSPLDVDQIVLVIRAFPIRVAGDSGELPFETDWLAVAREGGWNDGLLERTSVTQKVRRIARFDSEVVCQAIEANMPTQVVLKHVDYFSYHLANAKQIPKYLDDTLRRIEMKIGITLDWVGTGRSTLIKRKSVVDSPSLSHDCMAI